MQVAMLSALLALTVVAAASAFPQRLQQPGSELDGKRGFRLGAGDRFSHGFGKRLSPRPEQEDMMLASEEVRVGSEDLVEHLLRNPELLRTIVQRYYARTNDGSVARKELLGLSDD
jgi:hypothetical protein